MLMAADLPLPEHVFVHGFLLGGDGRKMSKSLGNVLDPFEAMDEYGVDALRYYLSRDVQFGADGSVSMEALAARYDGELANELGNLASRSIAMLRRYRDGNVPDGAAGPRPTSSAASATTLRRASSGADLTGALDAIWQRVRRLNRYVEEQAPWTLAKDEATRGRPGPRAAHARRGRADARGAAVAVDPGVVREAARGALDRPTRRYANAEFGAAVPETVAELEPLFPKNQR